MLFECKKNRKKLEVRSVLKTWLIAIWWWLAGMYLQAAVAAPPASLSFNHILASEVESVGYVVSIAQDNDGFMWFGGANGLARFDGYELTIYRAGEEQSTLSHSYINRILMASDGRMWLATRNGVNLFNPALDSFTAHRYDDQNSLTLSANDVNDILEDSEKRMWLATRGGFFRLTLIPVRLPMCLLNRYWS